MNYDKEWEFLSNIKTKKSILNQELVFNNHNCFDNTIIDNYCEEKVIYYKKKKKSILDLENDLDLVQRNNNDMIESNKYNFFYDLDLCDKKPIINNTKMFK